MSPMRTALHHRQSRIQSDPLAIVIACLCLANALQVGAASFQNLNFESSPSFPPGDYSFPFTIYTNALPGWIVHVDNQIQDGAFANEFILDYPGVALMTRPANPLDGQKCVYLQSAYSAPPDIAGARPLNVSISQIGLVPDDSQSLHFKSLNQWFDYFPVPPGPFDVRLGGVTLSLVPVLSNAGFFEYAADVTRWQGQTVELSIGVLTSTAWGSAFPEGWGCVDSINFSPTPVTIPAPNLTNATWTGGRFEVDVNTFAGQTITIISTTNLSLPASSWPILLTTNSPGNRFHVIDPYSSSNGFTFYRARNGY